MRRPNLTTAELDRIAILREVKRLSYSQIAKIVGCSEGSVSWACLRLGVDIHPDRKLADVPADRITVIRNGKPLYRFTQADDATLLKLEADGLTASQIGRQMVPPRLPNSIRGRLMTLARREEREFPG